MIKNDASVNIGSSIRIVCVATLLLAWQKMSNSSLSNSSLDVVATNDGPLNVSAHLLVVD